MFLQTTTDIRGLTCNIEEAKKTEYYESYKESYFHNIREIKIDTKKREKAMKTYSKVFRKAVGSLIHIFGENHNLSPAEIFDEIDPAKRLVSLQTYNIMRSKTYILYQNTDDKRFTKQYKKLTNLPCASELFSDSKQLHDFGKDLLVISDYVSLPNLQIEHSPIEDMPIHFDKWSNL